jgi:hypothetical protein
MRSTATRSCGSRPPIKAPTSAKSLALTVRCGRTALLVMLLGGFLSVASAQTMLVDQRVAGSRRVCTYDVNRRLHSRIVPLGQPCPPTYSAVEPRRPRVPMQAEFVREQRSLNGTNCVYRYMDREFVHRLDAGSSCPRTPTLLR